MSATIPVCGALTVEDGQLVARGWDGTALGRFYVGPAGVVYEGELTLFQPNDPPKLRLASAYDGPRGALGLVTFNVVRDDGSGVQEELAWLRGALAEDNQPGELRGQVDCSVRGTGDAEPRLAWIVSDAYTAAEYGVARMRTYIARLFTTIAGDVGGLWKWS